MFGTAGRDGRRRAMKLNWVEKLLMNNPLRAAAQHWEARRLLRLGGDASGGRVLEIGCGRGAGVEVILEHFHPSRVEAFDVDPDQVRRASRRWRGCEDRVRISEGSTSAIAAPDAAFDAVFDFGVLHHIPDNEVALAEIARVLKPGGRFFFMEILSSVTAMWISRLLTDHPAAAQFTWDRLAAKLAAAGLSVPANACVVGRHSVYGVAWKDKDAPASLRRSNA
jgi:ubiquinone/menaquinone biosynthesis C-methylase UbiE